MKTSYTDIAELSYEQAFAELEAIINGLEANQKTLEESIALYERGQALALFCAGLLDRAELRVRQLNEIEMAGEADSDFDQPVDEGAQE
jgi:exodeoxyribonuclease VII small subunit